MLAVNASAQFPATITITDGSSGAPLENASVVLDGNTVATDASGHAVFNGLADATYDFSVSASCYSPGGGSITIAGAAASASLGLEAMATNNLFWYIGDPLAITGASVHVYNGTGYDTTFVTWDFFGGEMLADVPFGTMDYTITTPCYETVSGTVTVDCNNGEGIAVFTNPAPVVIDATVTVAGNTLTASAAGMEYQWVDCNNGNTPISGATGQSFTPAESGSYAVVITGQDCPVTSACSSMVITGLDELVAGRDFTAFPVPFNEQLAVGVNNGAGPVEVGLFNMVGQRVLQASSMGDQLVVSTAHLPAGSYLLRIRAGGSLGTVHIVK